MRKEEILQYVVFTPVDMEEILHYVVFTPLDMEEIRQSVCVKKRFYSMLCLSP